jgi:hypothetical protein
MAVPKRRTDRDDWLEQDVPAAVVCALCGDADCPGCANEPSRSGVVAIVAWERPGAPLLARLWSTARAAAVDEGRFFESMPDGPVGPALRFAVVCELVSACALIGTMTLLFVIVAPLSLRALVAERVGVIVRLVAVAVPALAALLVVAHAVHGVTLDRAARRSGYTAKGNARRALRFGLYASGWDLLIGPLGGAIMAIREGVRASLALFRRAVGLPSRSARAFLKGAYRLEGPRAEAIIRRSYVAAMTATVFGTAVIVIVAILIAALS